MLFCGIRSFFLFPKSSASLNFFLIEPSHNCSFWGMSPRCGGLWGRIGGENENVCKGGKKGLIDISPENVFISLRVGSKQPHFPLYRERTASVSFCSKTECSDLSAPLWFGLRLPLGTVLFRAMRTSLHLPPRDMGWKWSASAWLSRYVKPCSSLLSRHLLKRD